jgi:flagellar motor switch protein FliM
MATEARQGDHPRVRPYDFRHPERLTQTAREQLREHESGLARTFSARLGKELRAQVGVKFQELTEASSDVFLDCGHDPALVLEPSESGGTVLFRLDAAVAQAFVDRLLGGPGELRQIDREPTDIEVHLLEHLAKQIQGRLAAAWMGEAQQGAPPAGIPSDQRKKHLGRGGVSVSYGVTLGETTGRIHLFYGHEDLSTVLGLETRERTAKRSDQDGARNLTREDIADVTLPVTAQFPATPVQIRDITSLQVGDVLYLGRKFDDEIEIKVGSRLAFYGYPGRTKGALGVRVSRPR